MQKCPVYYTDLFISYSENSAGSFDQQYSLLSNGVMQRENTTHRGDAMLTFDKRFSIIDMKNGFFVPFRRMREIFCEIQEKGSGILG